MGQVILTSRPIGYIGVGQRPDWPHYEVLPIETSDVDLFLHNWFSILAESQGKTDYWGEQQVALLKRRLVDRPGLQSLMRNPLMLTFLAFLAGEVQLESYPTIGPIYMDNI